MPKPNEFNENITVGTGLNTLTSTPTKIVATGEQTSFPSPDTTFSLLYSESTDKIDKKLAAESGLSFDIPSAGVTVKAEADYSSSSELTTNSLYVVFIVRKIKQITTFKANPIYEDDLGKFTIPPRSEIHSKAVDAAQVNPIQNDLDGMSENFFRSLSYWLNHFGDSVFYETRHGCSFAVRMKINFSNSDIQKSFKSTIDVKVKEQGVKNAIDYLLANTSGRVITDIQMKSKGIDNVTDQSSVVDDMTDFKKTISAWSSLIEKSQSQALISASYKNIGILLFKEVDYYAAMLDLIVSNSKKLRAHAGSLLDKIKRCYAFYFAFDSSNSNYLNQSDDLHIKLIEHRQFLDASINALKEVLTTIEVEKIFQTPRYQALSSQVDDIDVKFEEMLKSLPMETAFTLAAKIPISNRYSKQSCTSKATNRVSSYFNLAQLLANLKPAPHFLKFELVKKNEELVENKESILIDLNYRWPHMRCIHDNFAESVTEESLSTKNVVDISHVNLRNFINVYFCANQALDVSTLKDMMIKIYAGTNAVFSDYLAPAKDPICNGNLPINFFSNKPMGQEINNELFSGRKPTPAKNPEPAATKAPAR